MSRILGAVKNMPVATLVAASTMIAFSGCATRDWTRDYVKQTNAPVESRVAQAESRVAQAEQRDARMDARIGALAADTAAARSVADEGVRKSDDVDKRVSQAITDFSKLTLVDSTELHYPPGRYSLDAKQKKVLDEVNRKLADNPAYVAHIVGEADGPGREQYNAELSWRRALEVERYLAVNNDNAMINRIASVGEGEARATSQRADAAHRKVTVAIYKPLVQ